ncbi:focadhesin isoform X2 [Rhynchophorus ferrugineus]|uniref:focadhesin isoform X2 n=1 Tax=Rhynchophorus ferrugineus TaxID=354439 RepID=UPI003FCD3C1B
MEALETKLQSENPAFIAQAFSDLYKSILNSNNDKMYLYLKSKCTVSNTLIQETAQSTLLILIQNGKYDIKEVLADFITNISTSSNILPLTKVIFSLIRHQIETNSTKKQIKYQLIQHPIIKILQRNFTFEIQLNIFKCIANCYNSKSSEQLGEIIYPLYLYCLCNPNLRPEMFFLKDNLWSHILNNLQNNKLHICKILSWMQIQNDSICEVTGILLNKALESLTVSYLDENEINYLVTLLLLACNNLIRCGRDCRLFLRTLKQFIVKNHFNNVNYDVYLQIISKAITICSPLYIKDLLELCHALINNSCCLYNYLSIKSSLLLWMTSPSLLTEDSLLIAKNILKIENRIANFVSNSKQEEHKFEPVLFCNPIYFIYNKLDLKLKNIGDNHHVLLAFLKQLDKVPILFLNNFFSTLCALLHLQNLDFVIKKEVMSLLCKCSLHYTNLLPIVFSNILYHLSNTRDSQLIFELLKTLPLMVHERENLKKVLATIHTIGNQTKSLNCHARYLMYKVWEIDSSCYSNLESLLLQEKKNISCEEIISKAFIIKMIAQKRPELHGRDLIPHISKILNEYTDSTGAIPCSLVIDSLKYLCKAEIIDIIRTWENISPQFRNERRVPVIKSICSLLREVPSFSYTESEDEFNNEVIQHLWKYVIGNDNKEVIGAALESLTTFRVELICLNIPSEFLDEEKQPQDKSFGQRAVSGKTWIKFLINCKCREAAVDFLIELVSNEINNYLKYVYHLKKQKEPDNYAGLPTNSIVKVLAKYIKDNRDQVNGFKESLFIDCMKILSRKYNKPLPPLNWCFLQELIHKPELKHFCIDIACHQIVLSGSARRLVENYIAVLTETRNIEDCLMIYRKLKYIANSIQPVILKPFLEYSIRYAFTHYKTENLLDRILEDLTSVLVDKDVQNCNKQSIEDVLGELLLLTDMSSTSFIELCHIIL